MAEGYVVRRGRTLSGGVSDLNIWTGATPPEDEVGVFINSEIENPIKYIVPYNGLGGDGSGPIFTIRSSLLPDNGFRLQPCCENSIVYIQGIDGRTLHEYAHDIVSDVVTQLGDSIQQTPVLYGVSFIYNNLLYNASSGSSGQKNFTLTSFDRQSGVTSAIFTDSQIGGRNESFNISSAYIYNGNIYFGCASVESSTRRYCVLQMPMTMDSLSSLSLVGVTSSIATITGMASTVRLTSNGPIFYFTSTSNGNTNITKWYSLTRGNWINMGKDSPGVNGFWADDSYLYSISGTKIYGLPIENTSSNEWRTKGSIPLTSNGMPYQKAINLETTTMLYGYGPAYNQIMSSVNSYSNFQYPSVIVENGTEQNQAEIISGDNGTSTINVRRVYVNETGSPVLATGKVRVTGGQWTDIK